MVQVIYPLASVQDDRFGNVLPDSTAILLQSKMACEQPNELMCSQPAVKERL